MLEKRVYSGYAFSEHETEKSKINREIYGEIKDRAKVKHVGVGYGHAKYETLENPENLSKAEVELICDSGNLCFGYRLERNKIIVHTD